MTDFELLSTLFILQWVFVTLFIFYFNKKVNFVEYNVDRELCSLARRMRDLEEIMRYTVLPKIGPYSAAAGGSDISPLTKLI